MKNNNINMKNGVVLACLALLSISCLGILINDNREIDNISFTMCEQYAEAGNVTILLPDNDIVIEGKNIGNYEELFKSCKKEK
jgi:hypothetical protein